MCSRASSAVRLVTLAMTLQFSACKSKEASTPHHDTSCPSVCYGSANASMSEADYAATCLPCFQNAVANEGPSRGTADNTNQPYDCCDSIDRDYINSIDDYCGDGSTCPDPDGGSGGGAADDGGLVAVPNPLPPGFPMPPKNCPAPPPGAIVHCPPGTEVIKMIMGNDPKKRWPLYKTDGSSTTLDKNGNKLSVTSPAYTGISNKIQAQWEFTTDSSLARRMCGPDYNGWGVYNGGAIVLFLPPPFKGAKQPLCFYDKVVSGWQGVPCDDHDDCFNACAAGLGPIPAATIGDFNWFFGGPLQHDICDPVYAGVWPLRGTSSVIADCKMACNCYAIANVRAATGNFLTWAFVPGSLQDAESVVAAVTNAVGSPNTKITSHAWWYTPTVKYVDSNGVCSLETP